MAGISSKLDVLLLIENGAYRGMNDTVEFDAGSSAGGSFFSSFFPGGCLGSHFERKKRNSLSGVSVKFLQCSG
jgi:hypothetical protein